MAETAPITASRDESTTALEYATTRVPTAYPDETVRDILHQMSQADRYESMTDVAVIETGHLVGLISIQRLFAAYPDTPASRLVDHDPPVIGPGADRETALSLATSHRGRSIGVIDSTGRFLGLIPPDRLSEGPWSEVISGPSPLSTVPSDS